MLNRGKITSGIGLALGLDFLLCWLGRDTAIVTLALNNPLAVFRGGGSDLVFGLGLFELNLVLVTTAWVTMGRVSTSRGGAGCVHVFEWWKPENECSESKGK